MPGLIFAERRNWDVKCRLLSSVEKAKKLLDYKPEMQFEDGLKNVYQWFGESRAEIQKSAEF